MLTKFHQNTVHPSQVFNIEHIAWVGCGHKIVLREDMSYGEHVLWDDILKGGHVLQKNLSHGRTFIVENMFYRGYVL